MPTSKSFSLSFNNGVAKALVTEAIIHPAFDPSKVKTVPPGIKYNAVWDTGATNTVITKKVARECSLKPISMTQVHTAGGTINCPVYLVNIMLPNTVGVKLLRVTEAELTGDFEVLIGMDIITIGDFAITNQNGNTTFSFRIPSTETIDFVKQPQSKPAPQPKVGRNAPCPCGSGKKYKKCCGAHDTRA